MMKMNWSRGFLRLWVLFSVPWAVSFLIAAAQAALQVGAWGGYENSRDDVVPLTIVAWIVPVAVLGIGTALRWALIGFRPVT